MFSTIKNRMYEINIKNQLLKEVFVNEELKL